MALFRETELFVLMLDERKECVPPEFQVIFICFLFVLFRC